MIKHIRIWYLLFGIVIGFIGIFIVKPVRNIIYKYPNPTNVGKITYKDKNDVCYKYKVTEVDCDKNEGKLKTYPLSS